MSNRIIQRFREDVEDRDGGQTLGVVESWLRFASDVRAIRDSPFTLTEGRVARLVFARIAERIRQEVRQVDESTFPLSKGSNA